MKHWGPCELGAGAQGQGHPDAGGARCCRKGGKRPSGVDPVAKQQGGAMTPLENGTQSLTLPRPCFEHLTGRPIPIGAGSSASDSLQVRSLGLNP